MIYFKKSQPAPACLDKEKQKEYGNYKCGDVLARLQADFCNKCYICEYSDLANINVEHFIAHQGDKNLKFDWNNLFFACVHCNNTKLTLFPKLLNCTLTDTIEQKLKYEFTPLPFEKVKIAALSDDARETQDLLLAVYNGSTHHKRLESDNIRKRLMDEIADFQSHLRDYFEATNDEDASAFYLRKIKAHLHKASAFTAFKRWIIRDNQYLMQAFGQYMEDQP